MGLTIDWTAYDGLGPRARYEAVGKLIDEAKAAVAAKRAEIAARRLDVLGAPAAAAELGISRARVYELAGRHRVNTTRQHTGQRTEYGIWDSTVPGGRTVRGTIDAVLGDAAGAFDVDGIERDFRDAVNVVLDGRGIVLNGEVLHGPYPRPEEVADIIAALAETVDLGEIMARHDLDAAAEQHRSPRPAPGPAPRL